MRKIAVAIEYIVPVIYDHFKNKNDILLEFVKEGVQGLLDALCHVQQQHADPKRKLKPWCMLIGSMHWPIRRIIS
ncbi:hypothetical protein DCM91_18150 [Chitinophaga costaii]|nr:hypothetical protein DCM91_18150 [Chitinophaga costaii]